MDFRNGLGVWLLEHKVAKRRVLEDAAREAKRSGLWLEQVLVEQGNVDRTILLQALAELSGVPSVDLENYPIDPAVGQLIPREMVDRFRLLPLKEKPGALEVAMVDPTDTFAREFIKMRTGLEAEPRTTMITDLKAAVERAFATEVTRAPVRPSDRYRQLSLPMHNMIPGSQVTRKSREIQAITLEKPVPVAVSSEHPQDQVLRALLEVARDLASTLEPQVVIRKILSNAMAIADSEGASLILIGESGHDLYFRESVGPRSQEVKNLRLPLDDKSVVGLVIKNQASQTINDTVADPRHSKKVDEAVSFQTRSLVCCPVSWRGTPVGALTAVNKRHGSFTAEDQSYLELLAAQAAVALSNSSVLDQLRGFHHEIVGILVDVLEVFDNISRDHMVDVARVATKLARKLQLSEPEIELLCYASLLHDIGKVKCPDPHDPRHAEIGATMLARVKLLEGVSPIIRHHHECYDGSGFPDGLMGEEIPPLARILALSEAWVEEVALAKPEAQPEALATLMREFGGRFDPALREAFESAVAATTSTPA